MVSVAELTAKRDELNKQIEEAIEAERKVALADVREKCKQFGFSLWDLRGALAHSNYQQAREDAYKAQEDAKKGAKAAKK